MIKLLIKAGRNLDAKDKQGRMPLHFAANSCFSIFKYIFTRMVGKMNPHEKDNLGQTALHMAVTNECSEVVGLLINNGADPHAKDNDGKRPIDLAKPDSQVHKILLEIENKQGNTAADNHSQMPPDTELKGLQKLDGLYRFKTSSNSDRYMKGFKKT